MAKGEMKLAEAPKYKSKKANTVNARCTEDGGYIVELCCRGGDEPTYHPPEEYAFGKGDGGKVLAMIGKHLGIKNAGKEAEEEEHEES